MRFRIPSKAASPIGEEHLYGALESWRRGKEKGGQNLGRLLRFSVM